MTLFWLALAALVVITGLRLFVARWRQVSARVDADIAYVRSIPAGMVWVSPEELDIP